MQVVHFKVFLKFFVGAVSLCVCVCVCVCACVHVCVYTKAFIILWHSTTDAEDCGHTVNM